MRCRQIICQFIALLLIMVLCMMGNVFGQAVASKTSLETRLQARLNALSKDTSFRHSPWSFCVRDRKTGRVLASYNEEMSLSPASTFKLITTAAALEILGPDYKFSTSIGYTGIIKDSVLNGDIIVKGGGDPTLGGFSIPGTKSLEGTLKVWAEAIKGKGIKSVNGRIIGDDSRYETAMQPASWPWDDIGNFYGAGPCGLSIFENQYFVYLQTGKRAGEPVAVKSLYPQGIDLDLHIELKTGLPGSGDNAYIFGGAYSKLRYLRGTTPPTDSVFRIKGSLPDPALFCVQMLAGKIPCSIGCTTARILNGVEVLPIAEHEILKQYSVSMAEIVKYTNLLSHNLFAETLLKEIGKIRMNEGNTEAGIKAVLAWMKSKGIPTDGLVMKDGSGLSRQDAVSCRNYTDLLIKMSISNAFGDYYASLPVAGTRNLHYIGSGTPIAGNMRAKSGFMTGVRSYAGYVKTANGTELAFSFIINQYPEDKAARAKVEGILVEMGR